MRGGWRRRGRFACRDLVRRDNLQHVAVGVGEPGASVLAEPVRWAGGQAEALNAPQQRREIIGVDAEAQVLKSLCPRRRINRCPAVRVTVGIQVDALAFAPRVEPEFGIEPLRYTQIGHREDEAVDRMDGGYAGSTRCPAWCGVHGAPLPP